MIQNLTAVIKTFERPSSLHRLYRSIRKYYPELPIIVIDDGTANPDIAGFDDNVQYIKTTFDIGLSVGRNIGVSKVKTKYFVLLDDDFVFTADTRLENMYDILENTDFQIVSGGVKDFGSKSRSFYGKMHENHSTLYLLEGIKNGITSGYPRYDFVLNFFMAETKVCIQNKWDDALKLGEHEDFFYRLKLKNILITDISQKASIDHYPEQNSAYQVYRERVHYFQNLAAKKNGYKNIKRVAERKNGFSRFRLYIKIYSPSILLNMYERLSK